MSETLVARVGRILSGGLNSIVDAVENAAPEVVMEEAIREVDAAIDQVRAELGKEIANKHLANNRLMEANRRHEELAGKIELAVKEGRDELAEAAISRQIDIEAQVPVLEHAITEAGDNERELEGYVAALQAKKREMQDDLAAYRESRKEQVASSGDGAAPASGSNAEDRVRKAESTFERIMQRQTGMSTGAVASDRESAAQLAELEKISRDNRIKERLAAVKAATNSG